MGAELSKAEVGGLRRVGSSGALDRKQGEQLATSASAASLVALVAGDASRGNGSFVAGSGGDAPRSSLHSDSESSGSQKPSSGALFGSLRRSANSNNNSRVTGGGGGLSPEGTSVGTEDHAVESLDLPMVEWEGYVTKRGHLVRNWKSRFFTLEGNHLSCT